MSIIFLKMARGFLLIPGEFLMSVIRHIQIPYSAEMILKALSLNQIGIPSHSLILETPGETTAVQLTMRTGGENFRRLFTNLVAKAYP